VFTLVPSNFFDPAQERNTLSEVAVLKEEDRVSHIDVPQYNAVLVYTEDGDSGFYPQIYKILMTLPDLPEYNKILCGMEDGVLNLAIAQGKTLLLANSFEVADFATAEYFIFSAMRSLQLNPEVSVITFLTPLDAEQEISLYRYFKSVEQLCG